jgi:hypothetical protein
MKNVAKGKIQQMLVSYLMREGALELALPGGMVLELGLTQENRYGNLQVVPDYCWVVASQKGRSVSIDQYNLGIRYSGDKDMVCEYSKKSDDGTDINVVDVI